MKLVNSGIESNTLALAVSLKRHATLTSLLAVLTVTAIMLFLYGDIDYSLHPDWNLTPYRQIAQAAPGINPSIESPFVYRVLGPYVAGLLPLPDPVAFRLLNVLAAFALSISFFLLLGYVGIRPPVAALTTILMVLNPWILGFVTWDYFQVDDVLAAVFLVVLFWAMWSDRWRVFAFVLFLAAFTRESFLLIIPTAAVYLLEQRTFSKEYRSLLLAITPGLVAFLALRLIMHPVSGPNLLEAFLLNIGKIGLADTWIGEGIRPFNPLNFLPVVFLERTFSFFRKRKYLLVYSALVFASTFFGRQDQRLMMPIFIPFYLLVADIVQTYLYPNPAMFLVLLLGGWVSSLHHEIARYPITQTADQVLGTSATIVIGATAYLVRRRGETALGWHRHADAQEEPGRLQ